MKKFFAVVFVLVVIAFFVSPSMSPVFAFPGSPPAGYPEGFCYPPYYSQTEKGCFAKKYKVDWWFFQGCDAEFPQQIDDKYCPQRPSGGVSAATQVEQSAVKEPVSKQPESQTTAGQPGIVSVGTIDLQIPKLLKEVFSNGCKNKAEELGLETAYTEKCTNLVYKCFDSKQVLQGDFKSNLSGIMDNVKNAAESCLNEFLAKLNEAKLLKDGKAYLDRLSTSTDETKLFDTECPKEAGKLGLGESFARNCANEAYACFTSGKCANDAVTCSTSTSGKTDKDVAKSCLEQAVNKMKGSQTSGGGGSGGGPGRPGAQARPAPKEPVKTKISAFVHGKDGTELNGKEVVISNIDTTQDNAKKIYYRVTVGARLTPEKSEDPEDCIIDNVVLKLVKVNKDGPEEPMEITHNVIINNNTNQSEIEGILEDNPEFRQNCRSYWANLNGPGDYKLTASYGGDDKSDIRYEKSDSDTVEVKIYGTQAYLKTTSRVDVEIPGGGKTTPKAVQGVSSKRISWAKGSVAGLEVENQNGKLTVKPGKNSSGRLILTPKTTLSDGTLDTTRIPTTHFTVVKILKDGSVDTLFDNANYPNAEPQVFDEAELGDLSQVIRFEARTSFNNPGSEYASSQGSLTIDVADPKDPAVAEVEEKPWVKLSSDPYKDNIFAGDSKVTITAATNYAVEDPVFEVLHNGQNEDSKPVSATTNCQDGNGSCEYFMELFYPNGDYSINFKNKGVLADEPLVFSTKSKTPEPGPSEESSPAEKIDSIELLYKGDKMWSSKEGGKQIAMDLESGENVFELVFKYFGGKVVNKSFTVVSEPERSSPSPSSSSTPGPSEAPESPEPSAILEPSPTPEEINPPEPQCTEVRQYNECNGCRTSRRISQDSCGNYEVVDESQDDSSCTSGCPPPEPQQTRPRWYCEGDVIMEEENGQRSVYHDCAEEDESCRSKYTPGYESDAECYSP